MSDINRVNFNEGRNSLYDLNIKLKKILGDKFSKAEVNKYFKNDDDDDNPVYIFIYTKCKVTFEEAGYVATVVDDFNKENKLHYLFTFRRESA